MAIIFNSYLNKPDDDFQDLILADLIKLLKEKALSNSKYEFRRRFLIDGSSFYRFEYKPQNKFDFDINIDVEGDLYYEFR